jgi:hypothetical protein
MCVLVTTLPTYWYPHCIAGGLYNIPTVDLHSDRQNKRTLCQVFTVPESTAASTAAAYVAPSRPALASPPATATSRPLAAASACHGPPEQAEGRSMPSWAAQATSAMPVCCLSNVGGNCLLAALATGNTYVYH